jgi:hypothetical protein
MASNKVNWRKGYDPNLAAATASCTNQPVSEDEGSEGSSFVRARIRFIELSVTENGRTAGGQTPSRIYN